MPLPHSDICCRDAFDAVYGASAGAINATYFLTGQRDGVDIYAEDIANKTFCDLGRLVGRNAGACWPAATLMSEAPASIAAGNFS
jgi:predicted patatin/cPLA2 family phospholipase